MARRSPTRAVATVRPARRPEVCATCRAAIPVGEQLRYDPATGTSTCVLCIEDPLAVLDGPGGPPRAPDGHSIGRRSLAGVLDRLAPDGVLALHHRQVPEGGPTIDHLAVAPSGIWVLDARRLAGPIRWRAARSGGRPRLVVNRRDETGLLVRLDRQVREVRRALFERDVPDVRVRGALCFVDTEVRLRQRPLDLDGRLVTWSRALRKPLLQPGPTDGALRADLHRILATSFPPAR